MVLSILPVLPPELRPMVQLDGGRFATSDLNDLYRRVINRNNRLRKIMEINAPDSIIKPRAAPAAGSRGRADRQQPAAAARWRVPTGGPSSPSATCSRARKGRFRKNLLGKRVDYSGRSVIVVGAGAEACTSAGLPREMALELFKPHVMSRLVEQGLTSNIKTAKRMVRSHAARRSGTPWKP